MCQGRTAPISMTHVYGHKRLVYNEEADALAKVGAALSKVHKPRRVRGHATRQPRGLQTKVDQGQGNQAIGNRCETKAHTVTGQPTYDTSEGKCAICLLIYRAVSRINAGPRQGEKSTAPRGTRTNPTKLRKVRTDCVKNHPQGRAIGNWHTHTT